MEVNNYCIPFYMLYYLEWPMCFHCRLLENDETSAHDNERFHSMLSFANRIVLFRHTTLAGRWKRHS